VISVTRRFPLCSCTTSESIYLSSSLSGALGEQGKVGSPATPRAPAVPTHVLRPGLSPGAERLSSWTTSLKRSRRPAMVRPASSCWRPGRRAGVTDPTRPPSG
jgi:hypothetical protein